MKVLIISQELWSVRNSGGNVLSNLFDGFDAEFAQIYCSPGVPENKICKHYYQMTDFMMINNIFKREKVGNEILFEEFPEGDQNQINLTSENKFYKFFRGNHWFIFDLMRELLWKIANGNNDKLDKFVLEFKPDIIFAPCYANHYMLKLTRHISRLTNVKIISYISDDHYSLHQFRISILFWINKFILRSNLRKTFKHYDLTYTMTDEQMSELTKSLNVKMKILRKGADSSQIVSKNTVGEPIRLVYAGNLYCGRLETLAFIVQKLKIINEKAVKIRLDIYTNSELKNDERALINDDENSFIHGVVSPEKLKEIYSISDVALHVESFSLKYKLMTRISFSTKIVDCLSSGCAVLAISWKKHSGLLYLKKEDAAFCIDELKEINPLLVKFIESPEIIDQYRSKALSCIKSKHNINEIRKSFYNDFEELLNSKSKDIIEIS